MQENRRTLVGFGRIGAAILCVATVAAMASADPPQVTVNHQPVDFSGQPPIEQDGRVLVPLRGVLEKLGAYVEYDTAKRTVTAMQGDKHIVLPLDSNQATIDGRPVTLDVPARSINGSTMVPLRFVAESLGARVNYDSASNTVAIAARPGDTSVASNNSMPSTGGRDENYNYRHGGDHAGDSNPGATHARFAHMERLDNGLVSIRTTDDQTFLVPSNAPVLMNGNPIAFSDLRPGDRLTLSINPRNGHATRIIVDAR